jgi:glycosyltransferase involved in cell wall biosynthesis
MFVNHINQTGGITTALNYLQSMQGVHVDISDGTGLKLKDKGVLEISFLGLWKRKRDYDVIHFHGLWSFKSLAVLYFFACIPSSKILLSPHGMLMPGSFPKNSLKKQLVWHLFYLILIHTGRLELVVHSELEQNDLKNRFGLKSHLINLPFVPPKIKYAKQQNSSRLLFVGRLSRVKNIKFVFDIYNKLYALGYDYSLALVGPVDNDMKLELHRFLLKNDNAVHYGESDTKEVLKLMRSSRILLLPSLSENFGYVVLEAISCGLKVLVSKNTIWLDLKLYDLGNALNLKVDIWVDEIINEFEREWAPTQIESSNTYLAQYSVSSVEKEYLSLYGN